MRRGKSEVGTSESSEWVEWENESFRGPRRDPEGATKMVASSNHCIFIVSRDHLDGRKNALKKKLLT